jgi:hypothetical protein
MIPIRVPAGLSLHTEGGVRTAQPDHWVYEADCPVCDERIADRPYTLVFVGIAPEDRKPGGWTTGAAVVVHAACAGLEVRPA